MVIFGCAFFRAPQSRLLLPPQPRLCPDLVNPLPGVLGGGPLWMAPNDSSVFLQNICAKPWISEPSELISN